MLNFNNYKFYYDPYPYVVIEDIFSEKDHTNILDQFPKDTTFFENVLAKNKDDKKFFKKNFNNTASHISNLKKFLSSSSVYNKFYNYISNDQFIYDIDFFLKSNHIDLRLNQRIRKKIFKFFYKKNINVYFEFSSISSDGGFISPHTDSPKKIVTCIFSIVNDPRINNYDGIETEILTTNKKEYKYNYYNETVPKNETQLVHKVPFKKNQMLLFIKTHNSLHSVGPIKSKTSSVDNNLFRNTITVCFEIEE